VPGISCCAKSRPYYRRLNNVNEKAQAFGLCSLLQPLKSGTTSADFCRIEAHPAIFLKLRPNTLEKMRVHGGGPAFRHHGRSVRYHIDDLLTWPDDNRKRSTSNE